MSNPFLKRALVQQGARARQRKGSLGSTRWGQSWLQALQDVAQPDRLGRGLTYAQQGAVDAIVLGAAGLLQARVRGSRQAMYSVNLQLQPLSPQQRKWILQLLAQHPVWLDALLSGVLPKGIETQLAKAEAGLYPRSISSLQLSCSCPDTANPCKHSAAVLYELAQRIDEQPLLLFALRGVDLAQTLAAHSQRDGLAPVQLSALRQNQPPPTRRDTSAEVLRPQLRGSDFAARWKRLLPPKPAFFAAADLADLYLQYLTQASRFWENFTAAEHYQTAAEEQLAQLEREPWLVARVRITLSEQGDFETAEVLGSAGQVLLCLEKIVEVFALAARLGQRLPVLAEAYRTASALVQAKAVVPRVVEVGHGRYRNRWEAASSDAHIQQAVRALGTRLGADVELRYAARPTNSEEQTHTQSYTYPSLEDAGQALLSVLLQAMLLAGVEAVFEHASATDLGEVPVVQLLFFNRVCEVPEIGDAQPLLALQLWLQRLHGGRAEDLPLVIKIEELEDDPCAFFLAVDVLLEVDGQVEAIPAVDVMKGVHGETFQTQAMRRIGLLAECYAPFAQLFASETPTSGIRLYGADFAKFVAEVIPVLRHTGVKLLLPRGLEQWVRPRLSAKVVLHTDAEGPSEQQERRKKGMLGIQSLLRFEWQVALGDELLSAEEFAKLSARHEGIVRLRDAFVWLDDAAAQRLLARLARPPQPTAAVAVRALFSGTWQGAPLQLDDAVQAFRQNFTQEAPLVDAQLAGLQATLRPYQETGVAWLLRNATNGLGSILADDMGLGKTLQTIAVLEHLRVQGYFAEAPALVVVPTSLVTNWGRELARFAPELRVGVYHGPKRRLGVLATSSSKNFGKADVVLTTYGTVRQEVATLSGTAWAAVILDEAQQIKNPEAAQTEAIKQLEAPIRIALSGTPVENRLAEYWSVLDFANPGYFGPKEQFAALFAKPIEEGGDEQQLEKFRRLSAPFVLRRVKTDPAVIGDLPEKIVQTVYCNLTPAQGALYQQVVDTQLRALTHASPEERPGLLLKFMTAVKQVCNHPRQYLGQGDASHQSSGKAQRLVALVQEALAAGERVLIFTQYRAMGELLAGMLAEVLGWTPPFLHGGLPRSERDAMVQGMQNDGPPILLLSIKAGGTGLNLTAASRVVHYDLWWNPAVEAQATDRAFRIGQRRDVHVYRLVCAGTFEERIDELLSQKQVLAEQVVQEGGAWLGALAEALEEAIAVRESGS